MLMDDDDDVEEQVSWLLLWQDFPRIVRASVIVVAPLPSPVIAACLVPRACTSLCFHHFILHVQLSLSNLFLLLLLLLLLLLAWALGSAHYLAFVSPQVIECV